MQQKKQDAEKIPLSFWKDLYGFFAGKEKGRKSLFLLLILLLGIILMLLAPFVGGGPKRENAVAQQPAPLPRERDGEGDMASALEEILEHIDGISNVKVFIAYESGKESVYARTYDESRHSTLEQDREGGSREIEEINRREGQVVLREGGGGERALLLKENMPQVKGVIVVAKGAENSLLRLEVVRAIQSVLKLPAHRIAILPYGN